MMLAMKEGSDVSREGGGESCRVRGIPRPGSFTHINFCKHSNHLREHSLAWYDKGKEEDEGDWGLLEVWKARATATAIARVLRRSGGCLSS